MIVKTKPDRLLLFVVLGVLALAVIIIFPFLTFLRNSYAYHQYVRQMTSSFVYGENHNTVIATADGENIHVKKTDAQRLYSVITQTGMGKPAKDGPEETGMQITFGDGAVLEIRPAVITEKGRTNDTGVWFGYTDPTGKFFAYDTDKLQYENLHTIVR